jgi:hypothetical protein
MKSINVFKALGFIVFTILFVFTAIAQEQTAPENVYIDVSCIKAKSPALLSFMMEKGMAFNKEAQARGILLDWILLEMIYPNGADCKCDFRAVTVFTDMAQLDELTKSETGFAIATAVFGDKAQATYEEWLSLHTDNGSQVYEFKTGVLPTNSNMSSVRFFNIESAKSREFEEIEELVWKPVAMATIEAGLLRDWSVWQRLMPDGDMWDGNYITVAHFDSFAHMSKIDMAGIAKLFQQVHPGKDMMETVKKSQALSKLINEETMRVVARLNN